MSRLLTLLLDHMFRDEIPADRTTALLEVEQIAGLNTFASQAGVHPQTGGASEDAPGLARHVQRTTHHYETKGNALRCCGTSSEQLVNGINLRFTAQRIE
jgi:hypothetical protein